MVNGRTTVQVMNNSQLYKFRSHENHWVETNYQHDATFAEESAFFDHPENSVPLLMEGHRFSASRDDMPETEIKLLDWDFHSWTDLAMKAIIFLFIIILVFAVIGILICLIICCVRRRKQVQEIQTWFHRNQTPNIQTTI